ncbi:MAG: glycerophosphodiester phosphodiesterase [Synergistaceae bacterium]|nr:glycerophosphodiester phosphodiesterase [Synergistaceae bacterium]
MSTVNVKITAHSGCDGYAMNSREYILHALTLDIYALELDIRRDSDGVLILTHNPPESGHEYVSLEDAFSLVRDSRIRINCDLKESGLERDVLGLAGRMGIDAERVIFTGTLTDWRDSGLVGRVWLNPEEVYPDFYAGKYDVGELMRLVKNNGYSVLNVDYRIVNEAVIDSARVCGVELSLWTIDDPAEIPESLHSSCIINITTNYPSRIVQALDT